MSFMTINRATGLFVSYVRLMDARPSFLTPLEEAAPSAVTVIPVHPYVALAAERVSRLLEDNPQLRDRVSAAIESRYVPAGNEQISNGERARLAARCALKARAGEIDGELDDILQELLRGREIDPIDARLARELCAGLRLNVANADVRALDAFEAALTTAESKGPEADEALSKAVVAGAEAITLRAQKAPALCADALADYVEMVGVRIGSPALDVRHEL